MALMVGAGQEGGGVAVGIDYVQGLVDLSRKNVAAAFPSLLSSPNFELIKGDGWAGGPSWGAPYHAIHVGAAAAAVPAALLQQLAAGGKMVIPVQCSRGRITLEGLGERDLGINADLGGGQALVVISKSSGGEISVKYITSVIYVPLVRTSSH
ncbi:protein-l-isoaspartate o-methyltransferase, putative [Eimeria tenella]|uniref:protein-L-isoaspartate(D-aspartate) O-methyltransferase n=1 Tax=Eimeria tenella TaxID=5802 RepID=U6L0F6_EIMTE|nr:protein-l-isoaspartate o-methyltransferase, putative [Eimeria tenella]CDJ43681.1 protein-l-isoaspartate o-methyltransferase, putative [Eimeria tenella]|eukprot:XP_013234430.1 protein-l-isoaspartate o-methyltransferase, putative [Eimeria tenella]